MNIYIVDAFTDQPFRGNPAAVCILDALKPDSWMQSVASEMNLPETAFLHKQGEDYQLRWFTPEVEVDLCGHATLASAHILWEEKLFEGETIRFHTKSGELTATKQDEYIQLNFPVEPPQETDAPPQLIEGLGIRLNYVGKNRLDYLVEVEDEDTLKQLQPNFPILKNMNARGVIVTSSSRRPDVDFVSRCFFPGVGIDEDPVTGSAHCCLGPYWSKKLNKDELVAVQASKREGLLNLVMQQDRILISGKSVTTLRGRLTVG